MKHVKKINLRSKRSQDERKAIFDQQLKLAQKMEMDAQKKEMDALKSAFIELSEALISQSTGPTKDKLSKSLLELKTPLDDRLLRDDRINPLYIE